MPLIEKSLPRLVASLSSAGLGNAARAIMTTDTFPKAVIIRGRVNGQETVMAGMAKGAGMINPKMATLLSFVFTDALISPGTLRQSLSDGVKSSFNRITVDNGRYQYERYSSGPGQWPGRKSGNPQPHFGI